MKNKNIYIVSLGCPKNRVDTEIMLGKLIHSGYRLTDDPEDAGTLIVNTCGFLESAKIESLETIMELAQYKEGTDKKLVVSGCLTQRYKKELEEELLEADYLVGVEEYHKIVDILDSENILSNKKVHADRTGFVQDFNTPRINTLPSYIGYIKIAEGCSNSCSFCIIPKIRGTQRSRKIEDIVLEAKYLASTGVKELNLVAQELTAYGDDIYGVPKLYELLKELVKINDIKWIRLFYNYPAGFSDKLIDIIANEEKIVNYVEMPLQHISNDILKKMFRAGREKMIRELIYKLRDRIPNLSLRSSFIVGFPGETDKDLDMLADFISETKFEHLGVFQYSPEEGTTAAKMDNQIEAHIKQERYNKIMEVQQSVSKEIMNNYIGQELEVLVDGISDEYEYLLSGRHRRQAYNIDGVTYINDGTAKPGDIIKVKVTQSGNYDLVAHKI